MVKQPIAILGIDLGKNSCSVAGCDDSGRVVLRRRLTRDGVIRLAAELPACVMAMEACCGAHHLGRVLREQGHEVRLMSPEYVQPYVKAQKNDERDAEAIAEAATWPTMRFVDLKSEAQLDMQILHRARTRLVGVRTALINQLRALLLERGIVIAQGRQRLERHLGLTLDDGAVPPPILSPRTLLLIADMRAEWGDLDRRITALTQEFVTRARESQAAHRLTTIPGFGALNATALVAAIGTGETFGRARDLSAWLGLVPRQATTGGKPRLLGITKRGNTYLRTLLIHGARAALPSLSESRTALGAWLRGLRQRYVRELLRHARMRTSRPTSLCLAERGQNGHLQRHRGLVQSRSATFGSGLPVPNRLRETHDLRELRANPVTVYETGPTPNSRGRITLGADKLFDVRGFVGDLRQVTPHIAINRVVSKTGTVRTTAIDCRTTRHPGYAASLRCRKRIEEAFGWIKAQAGLAKVKLYGQPKVEALFTFAVATYNLVRLPKLLDRQDA